MEPTDFEKWCAGETDCSVKLIASFRREDEFGDLTYVHGEIAKRYRAYMAGVTSMLPYKTPAKGATNEG